jgi:hypothetical protein
MSFTAGHYQEVARIIRTRREAIARMRREVISRMRAEPEAPPDYASANWMAGATAEVEEIRLQLAQMFARQNPRFDRARFDNDCMPKGDTK